MKILSDKLAIIDIDGCLCEYPNPEFYQFVFGKTGERFSSLPIMKERLGEDSYENLKGLYRASGIKRDLVPLEKSVESLHLLKNMGFEILILTSRPNVHNNFADTKFWLENIGYPFDRLAFVDEKWRFFHEPPSGGMIVVDDNFFALEGYIGMSSVMLFQFCNEPDPVGIQADNYYFGMSWYDFIVSLQSYYE